MPTLSSLARPTVLISFLMLVLAITLLYLSQGFGRSSGMFPRFIGWVFVVLTAADVIVQVVAWYQRNLPVPTATAITIKQLKAMGWLLGLVVALSIFGFLITIPAYIFTFLTWRAGQEKRRSAIIAIGALVFVWVIFVWLLDYELYAGLLLNNLG